MTAVRRGAVAVLKYFVALVALLVVVQIFLAGEGIFGLKHAKDIGAAKTLEPHRFIGFLLTEPIALLLLTVALLAWHPDRRVRRVSIALPFLLFLQAPLSWGGRWSGAFHPLNAFLVLGLLGWLVHRFWRRGRAVDRRPEGQPAI